MTQGNHNGSGGRRISRPLSDGRSSDKNLFVRLTHSMIDSAAYRALTPNAIALYVYVARRFTGGNNGKISYSVREAANALHVSKNTAAKNFQELVDKGFIKCTQNSAFSLKMRMARRWQLTQWPLESGIAPSNDWAYWKPKPFDGHVKRTNSPARKTEIREGTLDD